MNINSRMGLGNKNLINQVGQQVELNNLYYKCGTSPTFLGLELRRPLTFEWVS